MARYMPLAQPKELHAQYTEIVKDWTEPRIQTRTRVAHNSNRRREVELKSCDAYTLIADVAFHVRDREGNPHEIIVPQEALLLVYKRPRCWKVERMKDFEASGNRWNFRPPAGSLPYVAVFSYTADGCDWTLNLYEDGSLLHKCVATASERAS